jgi:hypothetical protein
LLGIQNKEAIPMGIPAYFIADTSRLPLPVPAIPGRLRHVHRKIS